MWTLCARAQSFSPRNAANSVVCGSRRAVFCCILKKKMTVMRVTGRTGNKNSRYVVSPSAKVKGGVKGKHCPGKRDIKLMETRGGFSRGVNEKRREFVRLTRKRDGDALHLFPLIPVTTAAAIFDYSRGPVMASLTRVKCAINLPN